MKLTAWILLTAALVVLGAIGGLMLSGAQAEPRDLLESALRRFNGPEQDAEATLGELDMALRAAESSADDELAADILIARGRVLRDVEAYGPARADFERALARYRPGALELELELVSLEEETGELDAALERAMRITERDPTRLEGWTHAGQILTRMSEQRFAELEAVCDANLSDAFAARAVAYARRAAGMDADDPLRVSQLAGLRSLYSPPDQADSLRSLALADQASSASSSARDALVRSFAGELDRDAVRSYLELLWRSGRTQDAVDFGLAVVSQRSVNSSPLFMERLARVLIDAGRPRAACEAIQQHFNRNVQAGQSFYLTWCEALHKSERWKDLAFAASLLRSAGDEAHRSIAVFYLGVSRANSNQTEAAEDAFDFYTRNGPVEPFPGALGLAWRSLAASLRTMEQPANENGALLEAVRLAPQADGEAWLRLFHLLQESEPESLSQAELYLTNALCLLPQRTNELMPTWLDVGRRRMRASSMELELLMADQRKAGRIGLSPSAGPYELFRFAEMHRDAKEPTAAAAGARRMLLNYPGFIPAMDLLGDALREMGDFSGAAQMWIDRLKLAPGDEATLRKLARSPPESLSSAQLIELMQIDPENTGRLEVARTLKADKRPHDALAGLNALPLQSLGDAGVMLASELLIEVGKAQEALAMLARLTPQRQRSARAFELSLDAARLSGKDELLLSIIAKPPEVSSLDAATIMQRVDTMLAYGQVAPARALLDFLDAQAETRTRDVMLRRAAVALLNRDPVGAQDELDRAQVFDDGSAVAFGRLLAVLESRIYNRLPIFVRALYSTSFRPTRLQSAILAILDERVDEARYLISEGRRLEPREPNWSLLEASLEVLAGRNPDLSALVDSTGADETLFLLRAGDNQRNPRTMYARLLALESPDWRLWAVADFAHLKPTVPGSMWASYLSGRGQASAGMAQDAERTWRTVLRSWPTFVPAWDALEKARLERLRRFDHVDMVRLRADRRLALGARPGEAAEELLTEAWAREIAGNLTGALESVRASVELDQELAPAWFKLGQLCHRLAEWDSAIAAMRRAARSAEVETASPIVEEFVSVLRDARAALPERISAESVRADLAELALRFPNDPGVVLAQARAELDQEDIAPAVRVARAYDRLDRFLARLDEAAIATAAQLKAERAAALAKPVARGKAGRNPTPRAVMDMLIPSRATTLRPAKGQRQSLDQLRPGSTGAWKDFYQSLEPARAEAFVRSELLRSPGSLELWRMLCEALVAQGRRAEATRLFELMARMVPAGKTHRALADLYAGTGAVPAKVQASIAAAVLVEGRTAPDVDLLFLLARELTSTPQGMTQGLQVLEGLWQQRDAAIGRIKDLDIGQLYGTALVQRADPADRQLASSLLNEVSAAITNDRARKNLVDALALLAAQIPARATR